MKNGIKKVPSMKPFLCWVVSCFVPNMKFQMTMMKNLVALMVMINLIACVANLPSDVSQIESHTAKKATADLSKPNGSHTPTSTI